MKRLSVVISDEAFQVLKGFQEGRKISTRDDATTTLLLEYAALVREGADNGI